MKSLLTFTFAAAVMLAAAAVQAGGPYCDECPSQRGMTHADRYAAHAASRVPWHGQYYHTEWGRPLALVVPPTANNYTSWGWGVPSYRMMPLHHQFARRYPGPGAGAGGAGFPVYPTPPWPSDTEQFGVYHVRGPW
jgi:hypothetical protein